MMDYTHLNYSLANEDTGFERDILPLGCHHVLTIAGSGARVLPLLARLPRRMTCFDISEPQLFLTELRLAALGQMNYGEFCKFLGYHPGLKPAERKAWFLDLPLSQRAKNFLVGHFHRHQWQDIIYTGRWEAGFRTLAPLIRRTIGPKAYEVFDCKTSEEQQRFLRLDFPKKRWALAVNIFGCAPWLKVLIYGERLPRLNITRSSYRFYHDKMQETLSRGVARRNVFLNVLLHGELKSREALPEEAQPHLYSAMQDGLRSCRIDLRYCSWRELVASSGPIYDFSSLSDMPSYLESAQEELFYQDVESVLRPGGLAIARYFRHRPESQPATQLLDISDRYGENIKAEGTGLYDIEVLQRAL